MKKKIYIIAGVLLIGLNLIHYINYMVSLRSKLPAGASNVREKFCGHNDFTRYLKAKISEEAFLVFIKTLNYTDSDRLHTHSKNISRVSWGRTPPDPVEEWWNPSADKIGTYCHYRSDDEFYCLAKYENGYVYVIAQKW